jgi:hypothetical protein
MPAHDHPLALYDPRVTPVNCTWPLAVSRSVSLVQCRASVADGQLIILYP